MTDGAGRRGAGVRGRCAASAWGDIAVCVFSRSLPVYRKRATPGLASVTRRVPCCGASLHGGAAVCIHRSQLSNYTGLICHSYVKRLFFCASIVPVCEKAVLRALCGSNRGRIWPPAASLAAYSGSERLFQRFRCKGGVAGRDRPACRLQASLAGRQFFVVSFSFSVNWRVGGELLFLIREGAGRRGGSARLRSPAGPGWGAGRG